MPEIKLKNLPEGEVLQADAVYRVPMIAEGFEIPKVPEGKSLNTMTPRRYTTDDHNLSHIVIKIGERPPKVVSIGEADEDGSISIDCSLDAD